jgi:hypothetical protein
MGGAVQFISSQVEKDAEESKLEATVVSHPSASLRAGFLAKKARNGGTLSTCCASFLICASWLVSDSRASYVFLNLLPSKTPQINSTCGFFFMDYSSACHRYVTV